MARMQAPAVQLRVLGYAVNRLFTCAAFFRYSFSSGLGGWFVNICSDLERFQGRSCKVLAFDSGYIRLSF